MSKNALCNALHLHRLEQLLEPFELPRTNGQCVEKINRTQRICICLECVECFADLKEDFLNIIPLFGSPLAQSAGIRAFAVSSRAAEERCAWRDSRGICTGASSEDRRDDSARVERFPVCKSLLLQNFMLYFVQKSILHQVLQSQHLCCPA